ncbi:GGDEF domain-containing protein [Vreelandella nigrificans]|uniref:diguanylate cyclase n=1 Tax=Vreelandella nigrificans TaxID=2042704 RepID=A0A2A4HQZ0_9GAMM|nr:GGDEF domain-containing protein [Halomonas nigrificans]PCF96817.1 diguanylate cyclase [Halomonas nigrificans]
MSGTLSTSIDNLCHELALLCSSASPMDLFERLAKMLHVYTQGKTVALYRRLSTDELRLAYCHPEESTLGLPSSFLTVRCYDDLAAAELQIYELKGEQGVWGYIGHPPTACAEPNQRIKLLVTMASQRLHLLKAESMAARQFGLKSRRMQLSRDIKRLTSIDDILQHHGASWCDIFQADGIVLAYQGELHCFGKHPSKHQLSKQLQTFCWQNPHEELVELNGSCQGCLAAQLSVASASLGWLLLFRRQPLLPDLIAHSTLQNSLSYWMPLEASMALELADDLAVAITALEISYLNHQLTMTNQLLRDLAHTDTLTQCWNRYYTELIIEELTQSATPFTLLMFDIDDFKRINDTYGHATGDNILRDITHLVKKTLRSDDHLGRWGGEEFIVISKGVDQGASSQLANRLCRCVEEFAFPITDRVTISIGFTLTQPDDQPHQLLERIDKGMYLAKTAGKNQVVMC